MLGDTAARAAIKKWVLETELNPDGPTYIQAKIYSAAKDMGLVPQDVVTQRLNSEGLQF